MKDHCATPLRWQFLPHKSWCFWTAYPPLLVNVVCERPTSSNCYDVLSLLYNNHEHREICSNLPSLPNEDPYSSDRNKFQILHYCSCFRAITFLCSQVLWNSNWKYHQTLPQDFELQRSIGTWIWKRHNRRIEFLVSTYSLKCKL